MKIYIAGHISTREDLAQTPELLHNRLLSYYYVRSHNSPRREFEARAGVGLKTFIDSGAYSAHNTGKTITVQGYTKWLQNNESCCCAYANLDVIGDVEATWDNQRYMEERGLNPLPCFHFGEPEEYLDRYLAEYDYLALGGCVGVPLPQKVRWFDWVWSKVKDQRLHAFGQTSARLLFRYPWYSADSTSWLLQAAMGGIYVPSYRSGCWQWSKSPLSINLSIKSTDGRTRRGSHYITMGRGCRDIVDRWLKENEVEVGKSHLEGNEEVVDEPGACNSYVQRWKLNLIYFYRLSQELQGHSYQEPSRKQGLI